MSRLGITPLCGMADLWQWQQGAPPAARASWGSLALLPNKPGLGVGVPPIHPPGWDSVPSPLVVGAVEPSPRQELVCSIHYLGLCNQKPFIVNVFALY